MRTRRLCGLKREGYDLKTIVHSEIEAIQRGRGRWINYFNSVSFENWLQ